MAEITRQEIVDAAEIRWLEERDGNCTRRTRLTGRPRSPVIPQYGGDVIVTLDERPLQDYGWLATILPSAARVCFYFLLDRRPISEKHASEMLQQERIGEPEDRATAIRAYRHARLSSPLLTETKRT
jgi:hypothetical protein